MRGGEKIRENKRITHRTEEIKHTLRAVISYPPGEALARAVNGVAGAVVGTKTDLSAGPPVPAARTHCKSKKDRTSFHKKS